MDALKAQAIADLGTLRRDVVSAPEEVSRDRRRAADPRVQAASQREFEARREKITAAGSGGDERAARLRAWNTETTFERDNLTGQLENRYSGQGHRAGLQYLRQYDDNEESMDARFGEERRMYVTQRGASEGTHTRSTSGQDRFPNRVLGGKASDPRSLSGNQNFPDRERARTTGRANRVRAPSPRAAGTVRFTPGGNRVEQPGQTSRTVSNPGISAAATLRAAAIDGASSRMAPRSIAASPNSATAQANTTRPQHPPSQQIISTANSATSAPAVQSPKSSATTTRAPAAARPQPSSNGIVTPVHAPIHAQVYHNIALDWAAKPGKECDKYYRDHPDREKYLPLARNYLIKEAVGLVARDDDREVKRHLELHRDREWMLHEALKAKALIENSSTEEEFEAARQADSRLHAFIPIAKEKFVPTLKSARPKSTVLARMDPYSSESSTRTTISTSMISTLGNLAVTFYNTASEYLGIRQYGVNAPIHATLNIISRQGRYNPLELASSIETFAQSMKHMSQGLEGATLAGDGVWEREEEL